MCIRDRYAEYMAGDNVWVRDRSSCEYEHVRAQPKAKGWMDHHGSSGHPLYKIHDIMGLLLNAGVGFAKAWPNVLQYCCVDRTKGACANRYSEIKKNEYLRTGIGLGLSKSDMIVQAKRVAQGVTRLRIEQGVPQLGPKPTRSKDYW
eukprot:TRINITY_DN19758_c0_g1_i1.p1 TRINITY_DN19758_c0_g1~~TRINITY_DN19758_c0_g1_i1.p1  ORF type:complete len:147 (-),score=20.66 TRINITY_DN19758_c0_g1_i1:234-674(-)